MATVHVWHCGKHLISCYVLKLTVLFASNLTVDGLDPVIEDDEDHIEDDEDQPPLPSPSHSHTSILSQNLEEIDQWDLPSRIASPSAGMSAENRETKDENNGDDAPGPEGTL
jgi:hypothetical protein